MPLSLFFLLLCTSYCLSLSIRSLQAEKLKGTATEPDSAEMYALLTKVLSELNQTVSKPSFYVPTCQTKGQSLYAW